MKRITTQTLQETCHGCRAPHSKRMSSSREDQHQRELQQKRTPTRTKPRERERRERERERGAHTQRATQETEKTTDSEHIGPPECQSSLSRRQFRVKQFFFSGIILDEWVHIPTKKTVWLQITTVWLPRRKTHTQQQRRSSCLAPLPKQRQKEASPLCTSPPRPPPKLMNNIR